MPDCGRAEEIAAWIDEHGFSSPIPAAWLGHAAGCARCGRRRDEIRAVAHAFTQIRDEVPSVDVDGAWRAFERRGRTWRVAIRAAAIVAIAGGAFLLGPRGPAPHGPLLETPPWTAPRREPRPATEIEAPSAGPSGGAESESPRPVAPAPATVPAAPDTPTEEPEVESQEPQPSSAGSTVTSETNETVSENGGRRVTHRSSVTVTTGNSSEP